MKQRVGDTLKDKLYNYIFIFTPSNWKGNVLLNTAAVRPLSHATPQHKTNYIITLLVQFYYLRPCINKKDLSAL